MTGGGRTVLVLGASGFIGARVAAAAARAGWKVRAGARAPRQGAVRAPHFEWVKTDFRLMREPSAWDPVLDGVDAVVNCVGVLQDSAFESSRIAHADGVMNLAGGCRRAGVRRFVHVSAVGVEDQAGTAYARDKLTGEEAVRQSNVDWLIVRPSLVVAREVFGGTALMRGLAGFPGVIPAVGSNQMFRPVAIEDLAEVVVGLLEPSAEPRRVVEVAGPESVSMGELLIAYRRWLGFPPAKVVEAPRWLARPVLWFGDLAGWLGWRSALRTTSLRQLEFDVAGRGAPTPGVRAFSEVLAAEPAAVQDRWHARLFFLRGLSVLVLSLFWLASGLLTLRPSALGVARSLLEAAGLGTLAGPAVVAGAAIDIALGAAMLVRPFTRAAALAMVAMSAGYLLIATLRLPGLWLDPLGPWLKILPVIPLCLFVAATDDRR